MSSGGTRARRLRWSLLVAAATTAMVLAASLVLYWRLETYLSRDIDGDLGEILGRAVEALRTAHTQEEARESLSRLVGGEGTPLTLYDHFGSHVAVGQLGDGRKLRGVSGYLELRLMRGSPVPTTINGGPDLGYPFRVLSVPAEYLGKSTQVTGIVYLKAHERRLRHQQLSILWTTLAFALASWGIAWWASGRLFGPLEEAYQRESAFASTAAHELRTPLTALTGEIEVALGKSRNGEEYRAVLSSALEEARRLTGLVNHLLFLARADAGQEKLTLGEVDVGGLCRELGEVFAPLAEEKGLKLVVEAPAGLTVKADRVRLRQALANLLDNAVRHTAAGEVKLSASSQDGGVRLSVSDTGPGIPPERRAKLFERFARGEGSQGAGLGLSIVKWVAEAHGGYVTVESVAGKESVFKLWMPTQ